MLDQAGKRSPSAGRRACASAAPMHWPWCRNSQQRDRRHFCRHRAMRFDPDRFRPEVGQHLPRYAFMPFGGGPRICIGNHFALMEGQTILAQLSRTVRFESLTRHPIEPEPAPSHRTPLWFRSNSARSTTACSIETWSSYVTASIRRHLACPMEAASRSPSGPLVAFLLRRKWEKYRDSLINWVLLRSARKVI